MKASPSQPIFAFVSDAVYPYNKGGKETRLFELTTRLAKRSYSVHVYCMKWWEGPSDRLEDGVHLHGICPYIPLYDGDRRSIKQGVLFGVSCLKLLFQKFDVIDVDHMPFFPIYFVRVVCWLKQKPMQATWHEVWGKKYWQTYLGGIKGIIASWIEAWSIYLPDKITAVSNFTAKRLETQFHRTQGVQVIPNGIDLKHIKAVKPSQDTADLIFAGRLLKHKNVDLLIQAIALVRKELPKIRVKIVGEGPEKMKLIQVVKKLKLERNIELLPFKTHIDDLYALMKASKLFVLPSSREGFGLVVIEANACGIPVVTVNESDNAAKQLINDANGQVVNPVPHALAKAILKELITPRKTIQTTLDQYDWEKLLDKYEQLSWPK